MTRVVVGLVGYYSFVRGYPIGPEFKKRLEALPWAGLEIDIREMNWGPIAIVQDFQDRSVQPHRLVLVAAVDRQLEIGTVSCRRWVGGELEPLAVQDRIFEAVTGVIRLDNLLVIGEHFHIWPDEVITVEVQLPETTFGDLIQAELEVASRGDEPVAVGQRPPTPAVDRIMQRMLQRTHQAATRKVRDMEPLPTLSVSQLPLLPEVCHHNLGACRA